LSFITSSYNICTICRPLVLLACKKKAKKSDLNKKYDFLYLKNHDFSNPDQE